MELFEKAMVVSADGSTVFPVDGTVIENVVASCGRFMLDQSILDEPPQAVRNALLS